MYRYVRLILIVFGLKLCISAAVINVDNAFESVGPVNLNCELFERANFAGESIQIPESHKIGDLTKLTRSWTPTDSHDNDGVVYSFKLPASMPLDGGINCVIKSCTKENFKGNCTIHKQAQESIQAYHLTSFECRCDRVVQHGKNEVTETDATGGVKHEERCCEKLVDTSEHQNFTKLGKTIIGVGRNYL